MITHPKLSTVMRLLRPNTKPPFDWVCEQRRNSPVLLQNYVVQPVTQAEVDAVTGAQIATFEDSHASPTKGARIQRMLAQHGLTLDDLKAALKE